MEPVPANLLNHIDWGKVAPLVPTISMLLAHANDAHGQVEFVVQDGERITYAEVARQSAALARSLLGHGIGHGERVGMLLPNGPEFVVTWFAITRIGAVAVPISTLSSAAELRRIGRHSAISLLIGSMGYRGNDHSAMIAEAFGISTGPHISTVIAPHLRSVWFHGGTAPPWAQAIAHMDVVVICPPLSGPETMIVWTTKGTTNAEQEAQAGRDHREAA